MFNRVFNGVNRGFILSVLLYCVLGIGHAEGLKKKSNSDELTISSYRIYDSTERFPEQHFYEQNMDCAGGLNSDQQSELEKLTQGSADNYLGNNQPIVIPGGSGIDSGGLYQGGNANPGAISILPGSGEGNNNNNSLGLNSPSGNVDFYNPPTGQVIMDQIVNIGSLVWQIADRGRPTSRLSTYRAHALPRGVSCWTDLENWELPKSKVYTIEYKNKLGVVVANYSYRVSYVYGGNLEGVGKYLSNVTVSPVEMKVTWGFEFSSEVQIPSVFNIGSKKNPIAGMQVFVYWYMGNAFKNEKKSALYFVAGDGRIQTTE